MATDAVGTGPGMSLWSRIRRSLPTGSRRSRYVDTPSADPPEVFVGHDEESDGQTPIVAEDPERRPED